MFGLESWFIAAVISAISGGISAFSIKVAAQRNYHSATVVFTSSVVTLFMALPVAYFVDGFKNLVAPIALLGLVSGLVVSVSASIKIVTLRCIDATIYFPLFKVVSPLFAVLVGVFFFYESFSSFEWFGLVLSILVPLLLISSAENSRQNNLKLGLLFIILTSVITIIAASIQKYATNLADAVFWIMFFMQVGVVAGSGLLLLMRKQKIVWSEVSKSDFVFFTFWRSVTLIIGVGASIYAYGNGGALAIVYTINSLYILIPIILSIIYYNEHWNLRKVVAIALSISALALLK